MARVTAVASQAPDARQDARGFSLIEVIVAMFILTAGLLPLVGLFSMGVQRMTASTPMLFAREKAREAIESVHAARDTGEASWATIQNVPTAACSSTAPSPSRRQGNDGLVNTADDGTIEVPVHRVRPREIDINPLINLDGTGDT